MQVFADLFQLYASGRFHPSGPRQLVAVHRKRIIRSQCKQGVFLVSLRRSFYPLYPFWRITI